MCFVSLSCMQGVGVILRQYDFGCILRMVKSSGNLENTELEGYRQSHRLSAAPFRKKV